LVELSLYAVVPTGIGVDLEVFRPLIETSRASTIRPRLPRPLALLQGLAAAVSLDLFVSRPRSTALLRGTVSQHSRNRRPHDQTRIGMPTRARTRPEGRKLDAARHHSATPDANEPKLAANRRLCQAAKPPDAGRSPQLTTPWLGPRSTEVARGAKPIHLHDHFGEPERPREMTSGTALVACHLLESERSAEISMTARQLLLGEDREGSSTRRARPTRHETPPLPRANATRVTASGRPSVATCVVPASTVQRLERLQAAGSSPHRRISAASICLRRLPLRKQREDIRNTSTNLAHHRCK
jgi:hypothetical protein